MAHEPDDEDVRRSTRSVPPEMFRVYMSGHPVEIWEDPERPFGCTKADLERYLYRGAWVLLFNAWALTVDRIESESGS